MVETSGQRVSKYLIVSPVRDEEQYLERTIRSVVDQTIRPVEWIIVDDGSRDRTGLDSVPPRESRRPHWRGCVSRRVRTTDNS